ncbi:MAG: aminodeoxychorismate synthase component I [Proteobacteria bacterium]|nr:aminodeoxychorismate synthase component I [Pseudomonadota bacterium]
MNDLPYALPIPYREPLRAFAAFADASATAFLDSAAVIGGRGRYAYIAADPFRVLSGAETGNPFDALEAELKQFRMRNDPALPPFQGGAVGYLSYELGRHLERLPAPVGPGLDVSDVGLGLYDTIAAFDTRTGQAWIIACDTETPGRRSPEHRAEAMAARIKAAPEPGPVDWGPVATWTPELTRPEFEDMVSRVIDYIHAGDIFQANLTQRLLSIMPKGLDPFMLYRRLRALSPAPFSAFVAAPDGTKILSASPERFLSLDGSGLAVTRPIKGTRPRGRTPGEDEAMAKELISSEKDQAENLMIVDLMRNDLSRVCRLGSVKVSELAGLESFANVHHLVSEVRGTLFPNLGPVDLLRATFPGGSITGAPKIRAMEIINELEPARRGPYCGAIAWIGFDGAMDSSIVIRTLVIKDGQVAAQAGGGIVADSDPAAEYDESMDKVWALLQSLDPGERIREQAR